ncbi:nodulation protein NfeD [Uliginosibacterium sp. sgz301328]|uniref:NfeD family protein n=1 Tax=Uliginosibacterium sp. sgz301328 TaxID=3243764 RepID=UPI00359F0980
MISALRQVCRHDVCHSIHVFLLALGLLLASALAGAAPGRVAVVLELQGAVGPAMSDYVSRGLAQAKAQQARVVVLQMDTPGGLDTSMREIIRAILASPIPVLTYVGPSGARAASAGTYILYAGHIAAMAPGTNVGAATPVSIGGLPSAPGQRPEQSAPEPGKAGSTMEAKAINDAVAYIRALAEFRGRNVEWAEKAVREAMSLSAESAYKLQVIDILAGSIEDLLRQADGRSVRIGGATARLDTRDLALVHVPPDWRTRTLGVITNPNVALILLMIGFYGLVLEFMIPGTFLPGTVGAICLLLGLYALAELPFTFAGLGLILLGLGMMVSEIFIPSAGVLGIGGVVAFVFGATLLMEPGEAPGFGLWWPMVAGIAITALGLALLIGRLAFKSRRTKRVTGREAMIGSLAQVLDWADGSGYVLTQGERWKAVADEPLVANQRVRIVGLDGLTLRVRPADGNN